MRILHTIDEFRAARRAAQGTVGLAPTMGYLHDGHRSLVRRAREENAVCAAWIFVNPTQFGANEDYARYPRDEARDIALLEQERTDLLFMPEAAEIYPEGFDSSVDVSGVAQPLEGAARPGHFRGVATIVTKFFNIMQPDRAYFGQKDAQQTVVIRQLVRDLNLPVEVVVCPIVREPDGLAMSSRNAYLTPQERAAAPVLYRALCQARAHYEQGERDAEALRRTVRALIEAEPLANIDYVSVADGETLRELDTVRGRALVSLAVRMGPTRLIDNIVLGE